MFAGLCLCGAAVWAENRMWYDVVISFAEVELVTCLPFFTLLQDLDEEPEPVLQKNYTAPKRPLWESRHGMPETLSLERMRRDS